MNKIINIIMSLLIGLLIILVISIAINPKENYYILADCQGKDIEVIFKIPLADLFYDLNLCDTVIDTGSLLTESEYYYYITKRSLPTQKYDKDVYKLKSHRCLK